MKWKHRAMQAIGFLIPLLVAVAVLSFVEPMLKPSLDSIPLWVHLVINGVALAVTIGIVYWAVSGGIPPRYHHGR